MQFLIIAFVVGLGMTVGDIFFKYWTVSSSSMKLFWWMGGVIFYISSLTYLGLSFKHHSFVSLVVATIIINIVLASLAGFFLFQEPFTLIKFVGILLSGIAIFLLI